MEQRRKRLRICIASLEVLTEAAHQAPDSYHQAIPCTGPRLLVAIRVPALCSKSTTMGQVLRYFIASRRCLVMPVRRIMTEVLRMALSSGAIVFMERRKSVALGVLVRCSSSTPMGPDLGHYTASVRAK